MHINENLNEGVCKYWTTDERGMQCIFRQWFTTMFFSTDSVIFIRSTSFVLSGIRCARSITSPSQKSRGSITYWYLYVTCTQLDLNCKMSYDMQMHAMWFTNRYTTYANNVIYKESPMAKFWNKAISTTTSGRQRSLMRSVAELVGCRILGTRFSKKWTWSLL
jgi:hypothetical protein